VGWFKQIIKDVFKKQASTEETKNRALDALQRGSTSSFVAMRFITEMQGKDSHFSRSPLVKQIIDARDNPEELSRLISSYGTNQPVEPTQVAPAAPISEVPPAAPISEVPPTAPISEVPPAAKKTPVEEIVDTEIGDPQIDVVDEIPTNTIPVEGVPAEEEIEDEEMEPLEPEGQNILQSFEDRLKQDQEELEKEQKEDTIFKNPTILESFSVPVERVAAVVKDLAPINKRLRGMFHPEIKVEYEGDPFQKAVYYKDGPVNEDFVKIKISGKLPSPTDEIQVRIKEPVFYTSGERAGRPVMEADGITQKTRLVRRDPKGAKIFARINHHPLKPEEIKYFLKTEPPNSKLRGAIEVSLSENKVPYFNTITPIGKRYKWDDKFYYSGSQECYKCKARHSRNKTFLVAVVEPDKLAKKTYKGDDGTGNLVDMPIMITRDMNYGVGDPDWQQVPAREIPEEIMSDRELHDQEQLGGSCAESYEEIKVIEALEKKIKGWKKTSQEIEENNADNVKKEGKPERKDRPGGTRGIVPSERFFTVAIALLRESGIDQDISGRLPYMTSRYLDLIDLQNKSNKKPSDDRRIKNLKEMIPKITLDDQKIATEAINWWRGRLGGLGVDDDDKNKINLSILPTIDIKRTRKQGRENLSSAIEMMQTYLAENNVQLEPYPAEVQTETEESIKPGEAVLDNIKDVEKGNSFVSKLKHKRSGEWKSTRGYSHYFTDDRGKEYIIFDRYPTDPATGRLIREPSMNFNQGEDYYIRGKKGDTEGEDYYIRGKKGDTGRKNTIIEDAKIVDPNRLQEYGETNIPEATEQEVIPEVTEQEVIPINENIPVKPDVAPERGIGGPPVEDIPEPRLGRTLNDITSNTQQVINDMINNKKNITELKTLMPEYLDALKNSVNGFTEEDHQLYLKNFRTVYKRKGLRGMTDYMEAVKKHLEPYAKKESDELVF